MTFWKENGGSLLGHGSRSLRVKKKNGQSHSQITFFSFSQFLLLKGSHVSLGLDHFVHKLSKANGVVI